MRKKIFAVLILGVSINGANAGVIDKFIKNLSKTKKTKIVNFTNKIPNVSHKNKRVLNAHIDIPKLKPDIIKSPNKILLANEAHRIVKKGDFEKKFFTGQTFDNQLHLIVQSKKYGDNYFVVAKQIGNISPTIFKNNSILSKYIPLNKIDAKAIQTKLIDTLNKTGKYGWETIQVISQIIKKHPKASIFTGALAWYILDPESFNQALQESGKTLTEFLLTIPTNIVNGTGQAISEKTQNFIEDTKNDIQNGVISTKDGIVAYVLNNILGILVFVGLFIVWRKRNIIKEFLLKADEVKTNNKTNSRGDRDEF